MSIHPNSAIRSTHLVDKHTTRLPEYLPGPCLVHMPCDAEQKSGARSILHPTSARIGMTPKSMAGVIASSTFTAGKKAICAGIAYLGWWEPSYQKG